MIPSKLENLSFAWDRVETPTGLREKLRCANSAEWLSLAAWILREAPPSEVWDFLQPQEVAGRWDELAPLVGRRRALWSYLIKTWRELGKL